MTDHHYTECGLSNVFISGLEPEIDDDGDEIITIPAINDLHRTIATGIVRHGKGISGEELRFLRTEMGLTQAELGRLVHRDKQTIGRWERSEIEIDSVSEIVMRLLAIDKLDLEEMGVEEISERSVATAETQPISINAVANDEGNTHYELLAA